MINSLHVTRTISVLKQPRRTVEVEDDHNLELDQSLFSNTDRNFPWNGTTVFSNIPDNCHLSCGSSGGLTSIGDSRGDVSLVAVREEARRGGRRGLRAAGWLVVLSACVIRDPVFRRGDVFIAQFFPSYRPYTESYVRQGINIGKICCYYWVVSRGRREGVARRRRLSQGTE